MGRKSTLTFICILLVFIIFSGVLLAPSPSTMGEVNTQNMTITSISEPQVIRKPGIYQLTGDIKPSTLNASKTGSCSCFGIYSKDVIFDGMGYTIDGSKTHSSCPQWAGGFFLKDTPRNPKYHRITIRNVTISNWITALELHGLSNFILENVTITKNNYGVFIDSSTNPTFRYNMFSQNKWVAISGWDNENMTISDNTIVSHNNWGIILNGQRSVIPEITFFDQKIRLIPFYTFTKVTSGDGYTLVHNELADNDDGILIQNSKNNLVKDNTIQNTRDIGIFLEKVDESTIIGNTITNSSIGIRTSNCGLNLVIGQNILSRNRENQRNENFPDSIPINVIIGTVLIFLIKILSGSFNVIGKVVTTKVLTVFKTMSQGVEDRIKSIISQLPTLFEDPTGITMFGALIFGTAFAYTSSAKLTLQIFYSLVLIGGIVTVMPRAFQYLTARKVGVQIDYRVWWGGILIVLVTMFVPKIVFGNPLRSEIPDEDTVDRKKLILTKLAGPVVCIVLSLVFFFVYLMKGVYASFGFLGLQVSLMSALVMLLPLSPMEGEKIFSFNKIGWALLFFPVLFVYWGCLLISP